MSADTQNAVRTSVLRLDDNSQVLSSLIAPLIKSRTI